MLRLWTWNSPALKMSGCCTRSFPLSASCVRTGWPTNECGRALWPLGRPIAVQVRTCALSCWLQPKRRICRTRTLPEANQSSAPLLGLDRLNRGNGENYVLTFVPAVGQLDALFRVVADPGDGT